MSYFTKLSMFCHPKKGITKVAIQKALKKFIAKTDYWEDLTLDDGFELDYYDRNHVYDEMDALCEFLAPFVDEKSFIEGQGEEDELWIFKFDGKGQYTEKQGRTTYNTSYEDFMREHEKDLPPKIKELIIAWHIATRI